MINAPATANDCMSTLNNLNTASPENKKPIRISNATPLALNAYTLCPLLLILRIMGIEPKISMMAKSTIKALVICTMLKFIVVFFNYSICKSIDPLFQNLVIYLPSFFIKKPPPFIEISNHISDMDKQ